MLFRKLYIERTPDSNGKPVENWYMIIRTAQEVLDYMKLDSELLIQAMPAIPVSSTKSHLEGSREIVMNVVLQMAAHNLKENEKISPAEVLCNFVDKKTLAMLRLLERGPILVQQKGSYCDYDGYVKVWNAKVTEEVEQPGCFFPTDMNPIETDILFIENAERVPVEFERTIDNLVGYDYNKGWQSFNPNMRSIADKPLEKEKKVKFKLNYLKLRDPKYVAAMVAKAKVIAVQTQIADHIQLDKFMQLFSQLEGKTIYISTTYVDELKEHSLYETCAKKHNVVFI